MVGNAFYPKKIANGFERIPEVMGKMMEKAKKMLTDFERVGLGLGLG